jgi:hypothetical protein
MSDNVPTPEWSNDPPAQEPSFANPDAPTIQSFDSSSIPPAAPPPPPPPSYIDYGLPPAPPPPEKKKSKVWIWVVVIVVLLLLCCCCASIGGYLFYTNQSTSGMELPSSFLSLFLI